MSNLICITMLLYHTGALVPISASLCCMTTFYALCCVLHQHVPLLCILILTTALVRVTDHFSFFYYHLGKNKYVLLFMAHLVFYGWFEEIIMFSLIQGTYFNSSVFPHLHQAIPIPIWISVTPTGPKEKESSVSRPHCKSISFSGKHIVMQSRVEYLLIRFPVKVNNLLFFGAPIGAPQQSFVDLYFQCLIGSPCSIHCSPTFLDTRRHVCFASKKTKQVVVF